MPKVTSTVNQMRQEAKYAFTMRVTDTTSTQGEHDSISNEVAAMTHAKLSAISENDIPIDTIRAIYTRGAGKFTLTVPESFGPVARTILATIGLEQAGTGFKYRLRFEEIQDKAHKGQEVRDTNTWCHIKVGKSETASYATIRDAAKEACNTAGVTFIEDKFHELKRKEGVGQATGFYHCQFELKGWKFDWAATKKVARLGSSDSVADIILRSVALTLRAALARTARTPRNPTRSPRARRPHARSQQEVHRGHRPLHLLLGAPTPRVRAPVRPGKMAVHLRPHSQHGRRLDGQAQARRPGRPRAHPEEDEGHRRRPLLGARLAQLARKRHVTTSKYACRPAHGQRSRPSAVARTPAERASSFPRRWLRTCIRKHPPPMLRRTRARQWKRGRPDAPVAPLSFGQPLQSWQRDLHAEGIEPHPGPRYVSKNLNGIQGKGKLYNTLNAIRKESDRNPLTAVFMQDHRLNPSRAREVRNTAHNLKLAVVTAFSPEARNGVHHGGTMIVVPFESIPVGKDSSIHAEVEAVERTRKATLGGRAVTMALTVQGKRRKLMAAYAPARDVQPMKRGRFFTALSSLVTRDTVIGIDANCVPDVTIDVQSAAVSSYPNGGHVELNSMIDSKGLVDVARRSLGRSPFFSSHHIVSGGTCMTRIDQIYIPDDPDAHWKHITCADFFPSHPDKVEIDHVAIEVEMHVVKPKRGKDIEYINENIYDDAVFTSELESQVRSMWATRTADARTTWEGIKDHVRKVSLAATKKLRAHSNTESKRWRMQIAQLQYSITVGTATQADKDQLRKIKNQVRAQKQNGTLYETLEKEATTWGRTTIRARQSSSDSGSPPMRRKKSRR